VDSREALKIAARIARVEIRKRLGLMYLYWAAFPLLYVVVYPLVEKAPVFVITAVKTPFRRAAENRGNPSPHSLSATYVTYTRNVIAPLGSLGVRPLYSVFSPTSKEGFKDIGYSPIASIKHRVKIVCSGNYMD